MKVHYPKLYNMAHLFTFNVFTDFKGSNNYILLYGVPAGSKVFIYRGTNNNIRIYLIN